jgi:membrane-bound lytic murein transglycosylase B
MALRNAWRTLIVGGILAALAVPAAADPAFEAWLEGVRKEARERGLKDSTIESALSDIGPIKRVVELDRRQPEFKLTLDQYLSRVVSKARIEKGRARLAEHRRLLKEVSARYNVQPRFIVALWGIETDFGRYLGGFPVIPALASLAYDGRRAAYFRKELFNALTVIDQGHIAAKDMMGSWAGAMGHPQFIPSSYLAFAQDFDGDGRRDIWNNLGDVFASIANYLRQHGWSDARTWGRGVQVPKTVRQAYDSMTAGTAKGCRALRQATKARSLAEWQAAGLRRLSGAGLPAVTLDARLLMPDGADGRAFLVYRNYEGLLRYNCSNLYALTVGLLSDAVGERR